MAWGCTVQPAISALQIGRQRRLDLQGAPDGGFEQLLDVVLAQQASSAPDLGRVPRQARLVVIAAAEELPLHVLVSAFDD